MNSYGLNQADVKVKDGIPTKGWVKQTRRSFLARKFVEFCKRTDLHGYKYIVMEDLSTVER